jgi:hypothetical protein
MKYAMLGALLITFPALCALIYGLVSGQPWIAMAAGVSFGINILPFMVAGYFLGKRRGGSGGPDIAH